MLAMLSFALQEPDGVARTTRTSTVPSPPRYLHSVWDAPDAVPTAPLEAGTLPVAWREPLVSGGVPILAYIMRVRVVGSASPAVEMLCPLPGTKSFVIGGGHERCWEVNMGDIVDEDIVTLLEAARDAATTPKVHGLESAGGDPRCVVAVEVCAVNEAGRGEWCEPMKAAVLALPAAPTNLTLPCFTEDGILSRWVPPGEDKVGADPVVVSQQRGGCRVLEYVVYYTVEFEGRTFEYRVQTNDPADEFDIGSGKGTPASESLPPWATLRNVRVSAVNGVGEGPQSSLSLPKYARTRPYGPSGPHIVAADPETQRLRGRWNSTTERQLRAQDLPPIEEYEVEYALVHAAASDVVLAEAEFMAAYNDEAVVGDLAGQLRLGHNCFRAGSVRVKADKHGDYQFATFSALALKCYTFRYVCARVV